MNTKEFNKQIEQTFKECLSTVKKKNHDYSGEDALHNFKMCEEFGISAQKGILVRLSDKFSRISNLMDKENAVEDESISDSIDDAINYLAILKVVLNTETRISTPFFDDAYTLEEVRLEEMRENQKRTDKQNLITELNTLIDTGEIVVGALGLSQNSVNYVREMYKEINK